MPNFQELRVVDPVQTEIAHGFTNGEHVASALFPSVTVFQRGGQTLQFNKEAFISRNLRRAPGAAIKHMDFGYAGVPYTLVQEALSAKVPFENQQEAGFANVDLMARAVRIVQRAMSLSLEQEAAALATTAANYAAGNTSTPGILWSAANSTPISDVHDAKETVRQKIGMKPNTMVISESVLRILLEHTTIVNRLSNDTLRVTQIQALAALFGIDSLVVGGAVQAASATANALTDVWGKDAVLAYVPTEILGREQPSYGFNYVLAGSPMVGAQRWDETHKSHLADVIYDRKPIIASADSGYLIKGAVV